MMLSALLILQLIVYSITLWFGLYLVMRDSSKLGLRFAGLGLVSYAIGLALSSVGVITLPTPVLMQWRIVPILLPSFFWMAATWFLNPQTNSLQQSYTSISVATVITAIMLLLFSTVNPTTAQLTLVGVPVLFIGITLAKIRQTWRSSLPRSLLITLIVATLFFLLGTGLLIFPIEWLSHEAVLLSISFDMLLLGGVLGMADAYEEGTRLLTDALRSFVASAVAVLLLGGQMIVLFSLVGEASTTIVFFLFTITATAIGLETFSGTLQGFLDRLLFADQPHLYEESNRLRAINSALSRTKATLVWRHLDEETLTRLTRQALSHYNDIDKLASSPLTQLPLITYRLEQQHRGDTILERTHELKRVLKESILHLKPHDDQDFGTSDAWRYYNVLYFPYVLGLKPYSVRNIHDRLDKLERDALEWFQIHVPERTLYNWQTIASRLVAKHLWEIQEQKIAVEGKS